MGDEDLILTIELDKDVYRPNERILCTITLTNMGDKPVFANKRFLVNTPHAPEPFREITFNILSPSKKPVGFNSRINVGASDEGDFAELGSIESINRIYDLTQDFFLDESGEYTIKAVYENRFDFDKTVEVWTGQLESNVLTFRIK